MQSKLPCYECGSSDAMSEYEHHFKCFSCNKSFLKKDGYKIGAVKTITNNKSQFLPLINKGEFYDLKDRGISKETAKKYNISCTHNNDEWVYLFNYVSNNEIIKQKLRPLNRKDYKIVGDSGFKELFGQNIFKPNINKILVIAEGEFDAAVIFQETGFSAVSVPYGIQSLERCLNNNFDYISGFKYVILAMDNDDIANNTITNILKSGIINKFGPHKVRIAHWEMKDANELLLAGKSELIKKALWEAEEYRPEDLFTAENLIEKALKRPEMGIDTPWPILTEIIAGWRLNTIITIVAADGIGKTEIADEIKHKFITNNTQVWSYSCEQDAEEELVRQSGKFMNLPLHLPETPWDVDEIKNNMLKTNKLLWIWKPEKILSIDSFINNMSYCHLSHGVKYFIIDHLKGVESQMTDINNGMGKFFSNLKHFTKTHSVCIILLSHVAKDKKQCRTGQTEESWNRGRIPTKENIYGSSAISAWSDVVLGLSRDVEGKSRIIRITILKNRLRGNRGDNKLYIEYNEDTGRLIEHKQIDFDDVDKDGLTDQERWTHQSGFTIL